MDDQIGEAFYRFCQRQKIKPSALLGSIIDFYGRSEILTEKAENGQISKQEMLVELGQIVADMQKLSKANGELKVAIGHLLQPYDIHIEELGLI
jgi:hypothetical protein